MDGYWSSRIRFDVTAGTPVLAAQVEREIEFRDAYRAPISILTLFLKGTYFGHKPFGFQSLSYVIHGWDVS